ncbi:antibiotic transporter [Sulfolobales archaeon HS-7]|nr:antibiotic transporter [Sulfolobales archaeon HS-7]
MKSLLIVVILVILLLPLAISLENTVVYSDSPFLSNSLSSFRTDLLVQKYFHRQEYSDLFIITSGNSSYSSICNASKVLSGAKVIFPSQEQYNFRSYLLTQIEEAFNGTINFCLKKYTEIHALYVKLLNEKNYAISNLSLDEKILNVTFGVPTGKVSCKPLLSIYLNLSKRYGEVKGAQIAGSEFFNSTLPLHFSFSNYTNLSLIMKFIPYSYLIPLNSPADFASYISSSLGTPVNSTFMQNPALVYTLFLSRLKVNLNTNNLVIVQVPRNESLTNVIKFMHLVNGTVTGHLAIYADSAYYTEKQIEIIDLTTVVLVGILLLILVRSILPILVLVGTAGFGIELTLALLRLLEFAGYQVYYISSIVAIPIVFGVTIDYSLLILYRYLEGLSKGYNSLKEAYQRGSKAVLVSGVSVILGFTIFTLSPSRLLFNIGVALVTAALSALTSSLFISRALLSNIKVEWLKFPRKTLPSPEDAREKYLEKAAEFSVKRKFTILGVMILTGVICLSVVLLTHTNVSVTQIVPSGAESIVGLNQLSRLYPYSTEPILIKANPNVSYITIYDISNELISKGMLVFGPASIGNLTIPYPTALTNYYYSHNYTLLCVYIPYPVFSKGAITITDALIRNFSMVGGANAQRVDIVNQTTNAYFYFTLPVTVVAVLVYVAFVLKTVVIPPRLVATILVSSLFGLAIAEVIFPTYWLTPPVVFALMFSLGIDYDIFIVLRIAEEEGNEEEERIINGVKKAGLVITASGLILGGAFLSLLTANMIFLREIGVAVGSSVLFDTFVVRTYFVPAIMSILKKYNWYPRGRSPQQSTR